MEFKLGFLPSPDDKRDYLLASFLPPLTISLPVEHLTWLAWQTPVKYQAQLGACVGFTTAALAECFNYKELGNVLDLSEQFIYGESKKIDGVPEEEGTYIRAALTVLKNLGICEESYFPYEGKYPPSNALKAGAFENAKEYKIASYARVLLDELSMKTALFQNGPVAIGVNVYENFMSVGADGIVPYPAGRLLGGHAILVVGYTVAGLIIKNSWSTRWGKDGYCIMPWNVWNAIGVEAWSIVDVVSGKKPWADWLESDLELGWLVKNSNIFQGYNDGLFHPYDNVSKRHVELVSQRLGLPIDKSALNDYSNPATRGWIHNLHPEYQFIEERWSENLTRYQFAVLIGRYLKSRLQSAQTYT